MKHFPVIDPAATGQNILRLRKEKGFSVNDLQKWFGFDAPRAIYKWQRGETLPSVDNLFALSILFDVPMDQILVARGQHMPYLYQQQPQSPAAVAVFYPAKPMVRPLLLVSG